MSRITDPDPATDPMFQNWEATPQKRQVGTLDLSPKWVGVLPLLLAALESGTPKGRQMALDELRFMAMVADAAILTTEAHADLMAKRAAMEAKDHG